MLNLFYICILVTFTLTQAQVFHEDRYIQLERNQKINVTNVGYPKPYYFGTASQTKIRCPPFSQMNMICQVAVGNTPGDCTDYNGIYAQLDGSCYLNRTNVIQMCNSRQVYRLTSSHNTIMIGHYSTTDENSKTGIWFCQIEVVSQSTCDCGWSSNARIVGGTYSEPNAHPSMVALLDTNNNLLGAGTIIGPNSLLTVAHGISNGNGGFLSLKNFRASVGRYDIRRPFYADTVYSENFEVVRGLALPDFDEANDRNDMAILEVDKYFPISPGVSQECLPRRVQFKNRSAYDYEVGQIVGFGSIGFGMPYSYRMKEANVLIRPMETCKPHDVETKICAQSLGNGTDDACQGDSGGPLLIRDDSTGRTRLVGITQSGEGCGGVGFYEFVPPRMDWIMANIQSACLYP